MKAILWDGNKKINGHLKLSETRIHFVLDDFKSTNLQFNLSYNQIEKINYHKMFNKDIRGLEIISKDGDSNVFVIDQPIEIKNKIDSKISKNK